VSPLTVLKDDDRPDDQGRQYRIDVHAGWLFDRLMAVRPNGLTYEDAEQEWGWDRGYFFKVVRVLRSILASEKVTVPCAQEDGYGTPYVYRLTDDPKAIEAWEANRLNDGESRLVTIRNVAESAMHFTDGRSLTGKRARKMHKAVDRLIEDLAELRADAV